MNERPTATQGQTTAEPRAGFVVAFRALAYAQASLAMLQAASAGHLLAGNIDARALHALTGSDVIPLVAGAQLLAAVLLWKPGNGPSWPILVLTPLIGVVITQIHWGFEGRVALHVPTGAAFLAVQVLLASAPLRGRRRLPLAHL